MNTRFYVAVAAAFLLVFAGGIAAVVSFTRMADRAPVGDVSEVSDDTPQSAPLAAFAPFSPQVQPPVSAVRPDVAPTPTGPAPVADADLLKLASAVKLGNSAAADVTSEVWAREIPVAQRLLNGMCDCDQRNWLKHFVQTGQEAVAGSSRYPESVQLLAKLNVSNQDRSHARQ